MIKTISREDFIRAFKDYNREDNFSLKGLNKLYDYIVELEAECEQETELDVIDLCCSYTEDSIKNTLKNYSDTIESIADLENKTLVVYKDDENILFRNF
jgi:type I site-specific restriction endonuclease